MNGRMFFVPFYDAIGEYILTLGLTNSNSDRITPKKVVLLTPGYPGVNILLNNSLFHYSFIPQYVIESIMSPFNI